MKSGALSDQNSAQVHRTTKLSGQSLSHLHFCLQNVHFVDQTMSTNDTSILRESAFDQGQNASEAPLSESSSLNNLNASNLKHSHCIIRPHDGCCLVSSAYTSVQCTCGRLHCEIAKNLNDSFIARINEKVLRNRPEACTVSNEKVLTSSFTGR